MKSFRTDVSVSPSSHPISLKSGILTVGSCFADAIGTRLTGHKFHCLVNPFGAIYSPQAIHKTLLYSIYNESPAPITYLQNQEIHLNYDFNSQLSSLSQTALTSLLNHKIGVTHYFLKDAQWILITYGTAWIYTRNDTGEIVANCHKMPSHTFSKSLMHENEIVKSFDSLYSSLKKFNPKIRFILTVSPVRHVKDTLELNSVSKAMLRVTCHNLSENYEAVEYFPAFEMMIDDLRDYRFYKSDMLHPTVEAENYIWEKFKEKYFTTDTRAFVDKWDNIQAALAHKPFHPNTSAHQQFLKDTLKKLEELKSLVDVDKEIEVVKNQLL
jgi:hypothetical protein